MRLNIKREINVRSDASGNVLPLNEQCVSVCDASVGMTQRLQLSYVGGRSGVKLSLEETKGS